MKNNNNKKKFISGKWNTSIDVKNFIKLNLTSYFGKENFLQPIKNNTKRIWKKCLKLLKKEIKKHVLDIETKKISGIDNFKPGYIIKKDEEIVGLQSDKPLKRIINPYGGIRMVKNILKYYNFKIDKNIINFFSKYTKTHNQGVFDVYTKQIIKCRKSGILTGLPDSYGRGRIIGDYRRIALYGINKLIKNKINDFKKNKKINEKNIQIQEEIKNQIIALKKIKKMASRYNIDISKPAKTSKEAIQWTYFGLLAAVKENNGAAMSLGRVSSFFDIYIEKDLKNNIINEKTAQSYIDQFIIKLRLIRHLRTLEYDKLFAGDPTWITESIGGMINKKITLVTKTSFRFLHSLINLGPSPEPNMTILWSKYLPKNFKKYCMKISIKTGALQYENDDLMRKKFGSDYGISCCVSAMKIGKQMQYFGARMNLAKALLYSINGGIDEISKIKIIKNFPIITDKILNYKKTKKLFFKMIKKISKIYVDTMNIIHYMHDKYSYESSQMALHDTKIQRLMAFGLAGLSVVTDSLSAIKFAKVYPIRDKNNITTNFKIKGKFPKYGNDDNNVDKIAIEVIKYFFKCLKKHILIRKSKHTLSILTITSNIVYGKMTGSTPDGRKKGEPFAPGANPMHNRDKNGVLASLNSVSKIPYYNICEDGISNTVSMLPQILGKTNKTKINNLISLLDGYFSKNAHHINLNIINKTNLKDAYKNPEKYPFLTIRVSGYAVNFNRLTQTQKKEVIKRTFHENI